MQEESDKEKCMQSNGDTDHLKQKRPIDQCIKGDLDRGWSWMVLLASFGSFCLIGNTMYAVGIIHSTLLQHFNESVFLTSWAGGLHSAFISAAGPLTSAIIDRFSCRVALLASGMFYVVGYMATAFAPNIEVAILTCGIIAGLGGSFGCTTSLVVLEFSFSRKRNIAYGIAIAGIGVGLSALAPIMQIAREFYGPQGFFIILAAMSANVITFGMLCFPSRLETHAKWTRKQEMQRKSATFRYSCSSLQSYINVISNKAILFLGFAMLNYSLGIFLIYLHLPMYLVAKGFTLGHASYIVSMSGIVSVVGRIITGFLANCNKINDIVIFSGSIGIVSLATFIFPFFSDSTGGHVAYASIFGMFFGSLYVVITSINIRFAGLNYMSAATGVELFFGGIGALIGPVLAGVIVDVGGTYDQSLIFAAGCLLLAAVMSALTLCFPQIHQTIFEENINIDKDQTEAETLECDDSESR